MDRLDTARVVQLLGSLSGWQYDSPGGTINREFLFADFKQAFAFMTRVAALADAADHHPEWSNVYNRVDITLTTHDVAGLSMRDIELARGIDAAFAALDCPAAHA